MLLTHSIPGHDPCSLRDVPPDVVGAVQIPPCVAFNGHENCRICGHHWKQHQHIMIEYSERSETTTDPSVERAIHSNEDEATTKKAQIAALQRLKKELLAEHETIQKSQARFRHYLDQHSMTLYNDAMIEYYEFLIKDEKTKVAHGGSRTRLEQMETGKKNYEHFVNAMKSGNHGIHEGPLDADGVYKLIRKLYTMQHYGSNLKDCAKKTSEAYAATYRERSYRIRTGGTTELFSQGYAPVQNSTQYGASPVRADQTPFSILRRALGSFQPQPQRKQDMTQIGHTPATTRMVDPEKSANLYTQTQQDSAYASPSGPVSGAKSFDFPKSSGGNDNDAIRSLDNIPSEQPPAYNSGVNELTINELTVFGTNTVRGVRNEFFVDDGGDDDTGLSHAVAQVGMSGTGGLSATTRGEAAAGEPIASRGQKSRWFASVKGKLKGKK